MRRIAHTMLPWIILVLVTLAVARGGPAAAHDPDASAGHGSTGGTSTSTGPDPTPFLTDQPALVASRTIEVPGSRIVSLSPDGAWIAVARPDGDYVRGEFCVLAVDTLAERACADLSTLEVGLRLEDVTWSPDSSMLAFGELTFRYLSDGDLWVMGAATGSLANLDDDGFSGRIPLGPGEPGDSLSMPVSPAFSPDSRTIAFSRSLIVHGQLQGNDIATVPATGGDITTLARVADAPGTVYYGIRWAPDGTRLYYSYAANRRDDPANGIWVMDADGSDARRLVGSADPRAGMPAVVQVSSDGRRLLTFDPLVAMVYGGTRPVFGLADATTGVLVPVELPPGYPAGALVGDAVISPDGGWLLTVSRGTSPDLQVAVRPIDGGRETVLVPEGLVSEGPASLGMIPTWASNGTVLLPGGGDLSRATLLTITLGGA